MVVGVVLAAGASSRMGHPKALLRIGPDSTDPSFVRRVTTTLRSGGVDDVVVVIRPELPELEAEVTAITPAVRVVVNPAAGQGQLSSLVCALDVLDRPGVQAMLVMPVDLPLVSAETVELLLRAYHQKRGLITRPAKDGRHGHPVIFDRAVFDKLRRADPGQGARAVIHANQESTVDVPVDEDGPFLDVDTPEDYERIIGRSYPGSGRTPPASTG